METLRRTVLEMAEDFNTQMAAFQKDYQTSVLQGASPNTKLMSDFTSFRSFVLSSLKILQSQVELLFSVCDKAEMQSRKKILLLHGVPEVSNEQCIKTAADIFENKLSLSNISLKRCHRLGKAKTNKPRAILIKFQESSEKSKVWHAKNKLKGTGFTLSEFLTSARRATFLAARQRFGITNCWTKDGVIVVRGQNGTLHHITSLAELDAFCSPSSDIPEETSSVVSSPVPEVRKARGVPVSKAKKVTKK